MPKRERVTSALVADWANEHRDEPDCITYNRFLRCSGKIASLEASLSTALAENDRLMLDLQQKQPVLFAHRVAQSSAPHLQ